MRNGIINATSPQTDIWGTLTGTWEEATTESGWSYTKTPFFVACYGSFPVGNAQLPFTFGGTVMCCCANGDGTSTNVVVKVGQDVIKFSKACVAQIVAFGPSAQVKSNI